MINDVCGGGASVEEQEEDPREHGMLRRTAHDTRVRPGREETPIIYFPSFLPKIVRKRGPVAEQTEGNA